MPGSFHTTKLDFKTNARTNLIDLTARVQEVVAAAGVKQGLCCVLHTHSTAGIVVNSIGDPSTSLDLADEIDRLVPTRVDFHHTYDTPRDASGHVKAMLVGHTVFVPIENGKLTLGRSSGVLFCEFDGPRDRTVTVQIWAGDSST